MPPEMGAVPVQGNAIRTVPGSTANSGSKPCARIPSHWGCKWIRGKQPASPPAGCSSPQSVCVFEYD